MNPLMPFPFPLAPQDIRRRRAAILAGLLSLDEGFCSIPVRGIRAATLEAMLRQYDERFLSGFLRASFGALRVTLSSRLISAAGKFVYARSASKRLESAEIRMSSDFLFRLNEGPFALNGLSVATPQEAFLVVFEHELCHALETALFGSTGHSARFLALAKGLFGHTDVHHALPTRRAEAAEAGLSVGSRVCFSYEGRTLSGVLSYVGKTATVMVPASRGPYRDRSGRRYAKYRVPLPLLRRAEQALL